VTQDRRGFFATCLAALPIPFLGLFNTCLAERTKDLMVFGTHALYRITVDGFEYVIDLYDMGRGEMRAFLNGKEMNCYSGIGRNHGEFYGFDLSSSERTYCHFCVERDVDH